MPRFCKWLTLLCALLTFCAIAHAKNDMHDKDRLAIKAAYAAYDRAFSGKDIHGVEAFDANASPIERTVTQQVFAVAQTITLHTVVEHIQFTRMGATVVTKNIGRINIFRNGTTHIYSIMERRRDELIKSGDTWKQISTMTTYDRSLIDGKPVPNGKSAL